MKIGISVSTFPTAFGPIMFSGDLSNRLPQIAALGYQGIDLFIRRADEPGIEDVVRAIRHSGLQVAILAAVSAFIDEGLFLSSPDLEVRQAMISRMQRQIELAAELQTLVPLGVLRGKQGGEDRLKLLADSIHQLVAYAAPLGVQFALEPVNRYETSLINNVQQARDFLLNFDLPSILLLPDTFHMNIEEPSIEHSIVTAGRQLAHIHTSDSNRRVPGKGHLNWTSIISALRSIQYQGFLSFECIPGSDALADAREGFQFLSQFA